VDDIARDESGGAYVSDTFGVRYRIVQVAELDARSRRLFEKMF
jgi:ribosomal protein S12